MSDTQPDDNIREHSFDGIQEYDNALPIWWQVTFYLTILYAVLYVGYYHLGPGKLGTDRWQQEQNELTEWLAANSVGLPEEDILRQFLSNEGRILEGKALFMEPGNQCVTCHGQDLLGQIGPNLRDDKWKYGSDLTEIIASIRDGRPGGMPSNKGKLTQNEWINLALFIAHTNKTQKEPNGRKQSTDEKDNPITY